MSTLKDTLVKAGLPEHQAEVYVILASGGEMLVPSILEKTELSRATVYDTLPELLVRGLIEYRKEGREAYYKPVHPNKLFDLLEQKKRDTALLEDEMKTTIATLSGAFNLAEHKPGVRFFEGDEGIREVTFDSLRSTGTICAIVDTEMLDMYAKKTNDDYVGERVKKQIHKKMIVPDTEFTRARYSTMPTSSRLLDIRFLPKEISKFFTGIQIYDSTVSFSTVTAEKKVGVIITDEHIAKTHQALFDYIWNTLKP